MSCSLDFTPLHQVFPNQQFPQLKMTVGYNYSVLLEEATFSH
jgi:hypothetical protein